MRAHRVVNTESCQRWQHNSRCHISHPQGLQGRWENEQTKPSERFSMGTNVSMYVYAHMDKWWLSARRLQSLTHSGGKPSSYFQKRRHTGRQQEAWQRSSTTLETGSTHAIAPLRRRMVLASDYGAKYKPLQKPHYQWVNAYFPLNMSTCKEWMCRAKKDPPENSRSESKSFSLSSLKGEIYDYMWIWDFENYHLHSARNVVVSYFIFNCVFVYSENGKVKGNFKGTISPKFL